MDNYSTNINKTNNHLSPKESLNSDGPVFHQYQQSEAYFLNVIVRFVDTGGIVDRYCLNFL
jgi:hypothetical protein